MRCGYALESVTLERGFQLVTSEFKPSYRLLHSLSLSIHFQGRVYRYREQPSADADAGSYLHCPQMRYWMTSNSKSLQSS